jgi:hypothetical protein
MLKKTMFIKKKIKSLKPKTIINTLQLFFFFGGGGGGGEVGGGEDI